MRLKTGQTRPTIGKKLQVNVRKAVLTLADQVPWLRGHRPKANEYKQRAERTWFRAGSLVGHVRSRERGKRPQGIARPVRWALGRTGPRKAVEQNEDGASARKIADRTKLPKPGSSRPKMQEQVQQVVRVDEARLWIAAPPVTNPDSTRSPRPR